MPAFLSSRSMRGFPLSTRAAVGGCGAPAGQVSGPGWGTVLLDGLATPPIQKVWGRRVERAPVGASVLPLSPDKGERSFPLVSDPPAPLGEGNARGGAMAFGKSRLGAEFVPGAPQLDAKRGEGGVMPDSYRLKPHHGVLAGKSPA